MNIFGKNKNYDKTKCKGCLHQENDCLNNPYLYPCCCCKDRPNRTKDMSQFVEDLTDEEKKEAIDKMLAEEKRQGKFNY